MVEDRYFLKIAAMGHDFEHAISEKHFEAIASAYFGLTQVLRVEEQWEAVIQNYLDLERNLLDVAASEMIVNDHDTQAFADRRLRFGVKLSNLLSTCRAYLDHTPQRIGALGVDGIDSALLKALTKSQYDGRLGYRFMEALRNHAQHYGLPVHGATYERSRVDRTEETSLFRHAVATYVDLDELRANKKFKKSILAELTGDRAKTEPHIRDYIEGLSAIHDGVRDRLKDDIAKWLGEIRQAMVHYRSASAKEGIIGLAAFELDKKRKVVKEFPLVEGMLVRIERLQKRNRHLVNLSRRFVTSAAS